MRYQTYRYVVNWEAIPPFIPGDPPSIAEHRYRVPDEIIDADDRRAGIDYGRKLHGNNFAGIEALDVGCTFCEDRPVRDAREWLTNKALPALPCPRCGKCDEDHTTKA